MFVICLELEILNLGFCVSGTGPSYSLVPIRIPIPLHMHSLDRPLLIVTLVLVVAGFFIFSSASLGLLARNGATFSSVALSQLLLGVGCGTVAMLVISRVPYKKLRGYAPHLYAFALLLTLLVFIPGIGREAGGATRWLNVFGLSLQPGEVLKLGYVVLLAAVLSARPAQIRSARYGLAPYLTVTALPAILLLAQPDVGTFLIIGVAGFAMYMVSGARLAHASALIVGAGIFVTAVAFMQPYVMQRITTFIDPADDPRGSGYQIRQSLIAIGSGGWVGRGYGQSVQKFSYLPEPIGDSVFSVAAEEFGFVGGALLILCFVFFAIRGLTVAARAPDRFGTLLCVGIVAFIVTQAFANMGSMLGIVPLTGEPLTFISHGGSALFFALCSVGIMLNVSRYATVTDAAPKARRVGERSATAHGRTFIARLKAGGWANR